MWKFLKDNLFPEKNFSLDIGEPVFSLIESLRNDEWEFSFEASYHSAYYTYKNRDDATLEISFWKWWSVGGASLSCLVDWMTDDEKELMVAIFYELEERREIAHEVAKKLEQYTVRQEFMVALCPTTKENNND